MIVTIEPEFKGKGVVNSNSKVVNSLTEVTSAAIEDKDDDIVAYISAVIVPSLEESMVPSPAAVRVLTVIGIGWKEIGFRIFETKNENIEFEFLPFGRPPVTVSVSVSSSNEHEIALLIVL